MTQSMSHVHHLSRDHERTVNADARSIAVARRAGTAIPGAAATPTMTMTRPRRKTPRMMSPGRAPGAIRTANSRRRHG